MFHCGRPCSPPLDSSVIHVAPQEVCQCAQFNSATDAAWHTESLQSYLKHFEAQCLTRIIDPAFWNQHPYRGLFDCLRNRLAWNSRLCARKRTTGYWEIMAPVVQHGQVGMDNPTVPCMVWGRADHTLAKDRFHDVDGEWCQWWPMLCNPWRLCSTWGVIDCYWCLCADNAITGSRPWPVHRTRIFIITDELFNIGHGPVQPQQPPDWDGPVIEEVADSDGGGLDSDSEEVADSFEHVAEEQYNLPAEGLQSEDDDEPWEVVEA